MDNLKNLLTPENLEKAKDAAEKVKEMIPDEMLEKVTGAGDPFADIPRVPEQPIDDGLREDG